MQSWKEDSLVSLLPLCVSVLTPLGLDGGFLFGLLGSFCSNIIFFFFFFLLSDHKHGGVYSLQVNPYCMRGGGEATPP